MNNLTNVEVSLNFLIRVDRSVKPSYPFWVRKLEHPELECSGPAEYDLRTGVKQWLANGQGEVIYEVINGYRVYAQLKDEDALVSCLNLQDGLAIQQKGIAVFRKLFAGKTVFLWGSVVRTLNDRLSVPCLSENPSNDDEVVMHWIWLCQGLTSDDPALRFQ